MVIYCSHSQSLTNVKLCETLPISHSILQRFLYRFCLKNIHKILKVVGGVDDGSPPVAWTQIRGLLRSVIKLFRMELTKPWD